MMFHPVTVVRVAWLWAIDHETTRVHAKNLEI